MNLHNRLKAFIKNEGLTVSSFEAKMGFSNGSLSKAFEQQRGIGSDRLEIIFSNYPRLSADWLFRGHGQMFIDLPHGSEAPEKISHATVSDLRKTISALEKVVFYNEMVNEELRKQLEEFKRKGKSVARRP